MSPSTIRRKKILPHNLPSFLEGVVTIFNHPNSVVDLDVDVSKLQNVLFRKGYNFLETKEYEKGRALFQALLLLVPEDHLATYNLACAESLLGNREEAVKMLRRAVDLGYGNLPHLLADSDLENIRDMKEFVDIVTELKVRQTPPEMVYTEPIQHLKNRKRPRVPEPVKEPETEPVKAPEPVPEPVKVPEPVPEPVKVPEPVPEPVKVPEPVPEPVKVPEPVPEPIKAPEPVPVAPVSVINPENQKWETELLILHDVGYFDDDLLVAYLESTKGSVEQTVLALLDL